jgi:transcriptional regulator GlxA family with amidase domain
MTDTVGIFVFDNVKILDFAGPYEVFTTASRMNARGVRLWLYAAPRAHDWSGVSFGVGPRL